MFALVDATNFYASVHAIMEPRIRDMAYVVLGSNNGCVIARSEGARSIGVRMGEPWFRIKHLEAERNLFALSANFELYSAFSLRMHSIISGLSDKTEPYSIDEAWADLTGIPGDHAARVQVVRRRIESWLGLPTGAGIASTKTLAKLASHISKASWRKPGSYPEHYAGLCDLSKHTRPQLQDLLVATALDDIWGVGSRISKHLLALGLKNASDLANFSPTLARKEFGVVLERTIRELNGFSCIGIEDQPEPRKQLACTRSLARPVVSADELASIGATFAERVATKMRKQRSVCSQVMVFAMTSPFSKGPRYSKSLAVDVGRPTNDARTLVAAARGAMQRIYRGGYSIVKVGVILVDVTPEQSGLAQLGLSFESANTVEESKSKLMEAVDQINDRWGKNCIHVAATQPVRKLQKQSSLCPNYLTSWDELPIVRC